MDRLRLLVAVAAGTLLVAAAPPAAERRDLPLRPPPAPATGTPLDAHAKSYYAYCLAQQALLMRDYETARTHLEEATQADPSSPDLAMELARVYLGLRKPDQALSEARRAASLDPNDADSRRFIVDLFRLELSHDDNPSPELVGEALAAHDDLLRVDPDDADVRLSLARIYFDQGNYGQAAAVLQSHVKEHPEDTDAAYLLSRALTQSGDPAQARKILESAVASHPDLTDLRAALAEADEDAGDLDAAVEILTKLVDEVPDRPDYRFSLARVLDRSGRHGDAADQARTLVKKFADAPAGSREEASLRAAYMFLIETLAGSGEVQKAFDENQEAAKRFPDEERFGLKKAELLYLLDRDDEAEKLVSSMDDRHAGGTVSPSRLSMVLLRAGAYEESQKDFDRAEKLLRRAIDIDTGNHAALNYLGYMLADRNEKLDEALELVRKAVKLDSGNGAYLDSLGWTLFRLGRLDEAEKNLVQAASRIPDEPVVQDHLGDVYKAQGKRQEAIEAWKQAIRLGIEDADGVQAKIRGESSDTATP